MAARNGWWSEKGQGRGTAEATGRFLGSRAGSASGRSEMFVSSNIPCTASTEIVVLTYRKNCFDQELLVLQGWKHYGSCSTLKCCPSDDKPSQAWTPAILAIVIKAHESSLTPNSGASKNRGDVDLTDNCLDTMYDTSARLLKAKRRGHFCNAPWYTFYSFRIAKTSFMENEGGIFR